MGDVMMSDGIGRRLRMLRNFSRYYADHLTGRGYPRSIDGIHALLTALEKQVLYRLAGSHPPGARLVEIGSYLGGSSSCLAAGVAGKGSVLHCVDTFMAENVSEGAHQDTFAMFAAHTRRYAKQIQVHRGFSHEVVGEVPRPVDLLFIDGDHSWEGVTRDLRLYVPLLKEDGILILHDSAHPPIAQAIREFILPIERQRLAVLPNLYAARVRPADMRL